MRITCPHCGPRDVSEFTYQGDATKNRPAMESQDQNEWNTYVYGRSNPRGEHQEFWHHSGGCRAHIRVQRNTLTHAIGATSFARNGKTPS